MEKLSFSQRRELEELYGTFDDKDERITQALARLERSEPFAYITGREYFCNIVLKVTPDTLIPRPDTERVVEAAAAFLGKNAVFADLCAGGGAITLALADLRPDLRGVGVEISPAAYTVALENKERCGLCDRTSFICSDIFSSDVLIGEKFDAIISNPPYIPSKDIEKYPSLSYEPLIALDGGEDGLNFYRKIIDCYTDRLARDGAFIFEIGFDQGKAISEIANEKGFDCKVSKDYSGNDRVAVLTFKK